MISLCCFSALEPALEWTYTNKIRFDSTILFGDGWDWFGWENRQEATGPNGNYAIWRQREGEWWIYRDSDGAITTRHSPTEEHAKARALAWCSDEVES